MSCSSRENATAHPNRWPAAPILRTQKWLKEYGFVKKKNWAETNSLTHVQLVDEKVTSLDKPTPRSVLLKLSLLRKGLRA
jgi:hypothetical protein